MLTARRLYTNTTVYLVRVVSCSRCCRRSRVETCRRHLRSAAGVWCVSVRFHAVEARLWSPIAVKPCRCPALCDRPPKRLSPSLAITIRRQPSTDCRCCCCCCCWRCSDVILAVRCPNCAAVTVSTQPRSPVAGGRRRRVGFERRHRRRNFGRRREVFHAYEVAERLGLGERRAESPQSTWLDLLGQRRRLLDERRRRYDWPPIQQHLHLRRHTINSCWLSVLQLEIVSRRSRFTYCSSVSFLDQKLIPYRS